MDIDLFDIIPQRPPMVMIDKLVSCSDTATSTQFTIKPDCLFVNGSELSAEGMLENIAQTCAARIGYLNLQAGATVKLGFIGAVKGFEVYKNPAIEDTITTEIIVKEEIFGITLVDACIKLNNETIAETTMKIALSDIDAA